MAFEAFHRVKDTYVRILERLPEGTQTIVADPGDLCFLDFWMNPLGSEPVRMVPFAAYQRCDQMPEGVGAHALQSRLAWAGADHRGDSEASALPGAPAGNLAAAIPGLSGAGLSGCRRSQCRELSRRARRTIPHSSCVCQDGRSLRFSSAFIIGREAGCEIQIDHIHVSRRHAEVTRLRGHWVIRDLQSSNGLFVDGKRVDFAAIGQGIVISLGTDGPVLRIDAAAPAATADERHTEAVSADRPQLDADAQRYFSEDSDEPAGERTMMIRRAFQNIQRQQRRRHRVTIAAIGMVALAIASYAVFQYR